MRKLLALFIIAFTALAATGIAQAGTFDRKNSLATVLLGQIVNPPINAEDQGGPGTVTLVDDGMGGHELILEQGVWSTANYFFGTSLYTGVPIIENFRLTVYNNSGTYTSNFTALNYLSGNPPHNVIGPGAGGLGPLSGQLVLYVLGAPALSFSLEFIGGPAGGTEKQTLGGVPFTNTFMPWVTPPVPVTGITTNVISVNGVTGAGITLRLELGQPYKVLSTNGGFVETGGGLPLEFHTVTIAGDNNAISASQSGTLTVVAPMRLNTSPAVSGRVPGAVYVDFVFVPEPGTLLLLVAGAAGLMAVGWRAGKR